jgi:hypothetical protein
MKPRKDPFRIEIVIDRASAHRVLIVGGVLAILASAGAVLAVPKTFQDGDTLTAGDLNRNFSDLEARVATIESFKSRATQAGKYSVGAAYCGSSASTLGDLSGITAPGNSYTKAKAACEAAAGCSSTAHVCTEEEIYRSASTGNAPPDGWIMANLAVRMAGNFPVHGCLSFTTSSNTYSGWVWQSSTATFVGCSCSGCPGPIPLLCCD